MNNKLIVIGTICALHPFWIGILCATLQCYFMVNLVVVAIAGITLCILSLVGLGICMWKIQYA